MTKKNGTDAAPATEAKRERKPRTTLSARDKMRAIRDQAQTEAIKTQVRVDQLTQQLAAATKARDDAREDLERYEFALGSSKAPTGPGETRYEHVASAE
jgi:hypothetical protein